jgi:hypothetical protein
MPFVALMLHETKPNGVIPALTSTEYKRGIRKSVDSCVFLKRK